MASPTTNPPHKRTLASWPSRITGAPSLSGCTLHSDFVFDTSACWVVDPVPANETQNVFGSAMDTDITLAETECPNGRPQTKIGKDGTRTNLCISSIELHYQFYSRWMVTYISGDWIGDPYEVIMTPSSLDKCLPGPRSCLLRYSGTECPDGHTGLYTAVTTGTSSLFCCP